ncbi:hypothetical protein [Pedobacter sandarakinus]|uniref:hypothetical protein n=1 Tax=Pedobacter sandarakinus TaxID=353156 RepID=UPI0022475081|nr:hypothetical protein [Pedobacter sandarakinus]
MFALSVGLMIKLVSKHSSSIFKLIYNLLRLASGVDEISLVVDFVLNAAFGDADAAKPKIKTKDKIT